MARTAGAHGPAADYRHEEHVVADVNRAFSEQQTLGQRVADRVAQAVGSWPFIIIQSMLLVVWMFVNVYLALHWKDRAWDPYPFILLNLMLSFQAAYTGPVVMMSQNRQSEKDRLMAENDYHINQKAEEEIKVIMEHLVYQDRLLHELLERLPEPQPAT